MEEAWVPALAAAGLAAVRVGVAGAVGALGALERAAAAWETAVWATAEAAGGEGPAMAGAYEAWGPTAGRAGRKGRRKTLCSAQHAWFQQARAGGTPEVCSAELAESLRGHVPL